MLISKETIERFNQDTRDHALEMVNDNGLYRHLICRRGSSSTYMFGIVTWPMYLCIYGDMGTYVFSRTVDMFEFFRRDGESIPLHYWAEKIESSDKCSGVTEYSKAAFVEAVNSYFTDWVESGDLDDLAIRGAVRDELDELVEAAECEHDAHRMASDFVSSSGHTLSDFWEKDLTTYTYHYQWCCLAIRKAISLYEARVWQVQ
jgi:hypothetical protein